MKDRVLLIAGDAYAVGSEVADGSVSLVLTDPPYGTSYASWDQDFDVKRFWTLCDRVLRPGGAVVLTASQPFSSLLVTSRPDWFRCAWVWDKAHAANFANAKRQPLKVHEDVLVFAAKQPTYNPQKVPGQTNHTRGKGFASTVETRLIVAEAGAGDQSGMKYPKSIIAIPKHSSQVGLHPTQKPVELFSYLIRTYSNPEELVLDPFAGSGTAGLAAVETRRRAVLIEREPRYAEVIAKRLGDIRQDEIGAAQ